MRLVSAWVPLNERAKVVSFYSAGESAGTIIGFAASGFLCKYGFAGGWPSVFYTFAIMGTLWLFFWHFLVYDDPTCHPTISEPERKHIQLSLAGKESSQEKDPVPWVSMLTSVPLIALLVAEFATSWTWYTAIISLPQYFNDVLQLDITTNGLYKTVPYCVSMVMQCTAGIIADRCLQKDIISLTRLRKCIVSSGLVLSSGFIAASGFLSADTQSLAVVLLSMSVGLSGMVIGGTHVNVLDLAHRHCSIVMGVTTIVSIIPGFVSPILTGALTPQGLAEEWQRVFFISGSLSFLGGLFYLVFGSGQEQPWAVGQTSSDKKWNDGHNLQSLPLNNRKTDIQMSDACDTQTPLAVNCKTKEEYLFTSQL